jgi:tRNA(Ile2) C34 agmatinyltransferase TiaS
MRVPGLRKFKLRAKMRRHRKSKVARVAAVRVDQQVTCPSCGGRMHLSELWKFNCEQCKQEITAEQAFAILETAGA